MPPVSRRRDHGVRRVYSVAAEVHYGRASQGRQRHGRDGGRCNRHVARPEVHALAEVHAPAQLHCGQDTISTDDQDRRYRGIADRGVADLAGDEDRAEQRRREAPARSPVDQQEGDQHDRDGPGVIGILKDEPDTWRRQQRCGQHRDHDSAADRRGQASAARPCHGDGAGHDDEVRQRGAQMNGHDVQPGKDFRDRIQRHLERVEGGVAKDPAVQQQIAVQHVPALQRIVRAVRVRWDAERYPKQQREQH